MIEIKHLSKRFGKLQALDDVHLSLGKGQCVALIGPNGCGKTTLIKSILGMVVPDRGEMLFEGRNIRQDTRYRQDIGYMPQIGRYPENMTIGQVIDMIQGIRRHPGDIDTDLYRQFKIDTLSGKKMRTLSGGTTQKVSATLAFMFSPKVLILDEPTAGLDPLASEILKEKIILSKERDSLIIITSHLLSELEGLVSHVVFMQEGRIRLHNNVDELKKITGQNTIAGSVVQLLKTSSYG